MRAQLARICLAFPSNPATLAAMKQLITMRAMLALLALAGAALALFSGAVGSGPLQAQTGGASVAKGAPARAAAVFAGGCFWCTEADFDKMTGVISTTSGYIGGTVDRPTYAQVSRGDTGHIEAVRVIYDPRRTSYAALVRQFLRTVDPHDDGGSFCDRGYQYRAALFPANPAQRKAVDEALAEARKQLIQPVNILILPSSRFWPAEDYHQDYYRKNPVRYKYYRWNCGRDQRLQVVWGKPAR